MGKRTQRGPPALPVLGPTPQTCRNAELLLLSKRPRPPRRDAQRKCLSLTTTPRWKEGVPGTDSVSFWSDPGISPSHGTWEGRGRMVAQGRQGQERKCPDLNGLVFELPKCNGKIQVSGTRLDRQVPFAPFFLHNVFLVPHLR